MTIQVTNAPTLAARVFPAARDATDMVRAVLLAVAGAALLAIAAKVQVPFWPVPMTLQPLAVLAIGAAFGARLGMATVALYLAEGLMGLPVFAGATAGPAYMAGPTAGYLAGFVAAAGLVGWLAERGFDRTTVRMAAAMMLGMAAIYLPGVVWLSTLIGVEKAVAAGLVPFLLGDAVKIAVAAIAFPLVWRMLGRA